MSGGLIGASLTGLLAAAELGLTAHVAREKDIMHDRFLRENRHIYVMFVSVWTTVSLLVHGTFPFIVAAVWTAITAALWLVAGVLIGVNSCADYWNIDPGRGEVSTEAGGAPPSTPILACQAAIGDEHWLTL